MPIPDLTTLLAVRTPFLSRYRFVIWTTIIFFAITAVLFILIIDSKISVFTEKETPLAEKGPSLPPFPLGVNPAEKTITEDPRVDDYVTTFVATNHTAPSFNESWFDRAVSKLASLDWYQNLASPVTRILIIQSGERHEEIAKNFARILHWSKSDEAMFIKLIAAGVPKTDDGKLYPGRYVVTSDATPDQVASAVAERFDAEVRTRYDDSIEAKIPLKQALIVASLIEREAYDFDDMRYISGVIWNRLFTGMKLQIDATLQYSKGANSAAAGGPWWPVPKSEDKFITSPFNTYKNVGLPPEPIANPSIDAIIAALNPRDTDCLFYYHTNDGTFYCNKTYEAHVAGINKHLK